MVMNEAQLNRGSGLLMIHSLNSPSENGLILQKHLQDCLNRISAYHNVCISQVSTARSHIFARISIVKPATVHVSYNDGNIRVQI